MEYVVRARLQQAAEIYNEFDFSDSPNDRVTVSFGEDILPGADGAPFWAVE